MPSRLAFWHRLLVRGYFFPGSSPRDIFPTISGKEARDKGPSGPVHHHFSEGGLSMTKKKNSQSISEELNRTEEKIKYLKQQKKILSKQQTEQHRKERTHRLCTFGGMVEGFLKEPGTFSENEVYDLLKLAFSQPVVDTALRNHLKQKSKQEERPENQSN